MARFRQWVKGQLVGFADLLDSNEATRNLAGLVAYGVTGTQAFLPRSNALACVAGTGMQVKIGGANQYAFLPDPNGFASRVANALAQSSQAINAADPTNPRNDLICIKFNPAADVAFTTSLRNPDGTINAGYTAYQVDETYAILYVAGTPAATPVDPGVPAGYVAFARVRVLAAASSIDNAHIDILLPSLASLFVSSLNGLTGQISLESTDNSVQITGDGTSKLNLSVQAQNTVGAVIIKRVRTGAVMSSYNLALGTLPGGPSALWDLYANVSMELASGSLQITAGGGDATWNAGISVGDSAGTELAELIGTAAGGQSPTAAAFGNGTAAVPSYYGVFSLTAVRRT
jgi:hypothetical protein